MQTKELAKDFGEYGGQFVPETLMPALAELEICYLEAIEDQDFKDQLNYYLQNYVGRPSPLYYAESLTKHYGGGRIYLKREDLNHTGAHKINNAIGQALLAKRLGKKLIVAETGAGQHGVATATACALLDLECKVFMGAEDIKRQAPNVYRMELLGAQVVPVESGSRTLKDATSEAIRYWVTNVVSTHYIIGSTVGPHPYPTLVRDFQRIIGDEVKQQFWEAYSLSSGLHMQGLRAQRACPKLAVANEDSHNAADGAMSPDYIIACVGGGSNAMGIFYPYLEEARKQETKLIAIEAAGEGLDGKHAASISKGKPGVLHGSKSYLLQDEFGQIQEAHSISAGLDYPGIGPEHSFLNDEGLVDYQSITDKEALAAFKLLCRLEGIIPALESSHALAYLEKLKTNPDQTIVLNLSGRGDKDLQQISNC